MGVGVISCNHLVCEEHLRIHQKNPRTIRHKDIFPANQHPTTGPGGPKDFVPKENRSGVIDQIPCSRCPQTYIGQTGRTLGQRLKKHQRAVRDRNTSTSALPDHVCSTGHLVDWDKAPIVDSCPHTSKRCLLESWMIRKQPSTLNRELGPLPPVYKQLF